MIPGSSLNREGRNKTNDHLTYVDLRTLGRRPSASRQSATHLDHCRQYYGNPGLRDTQVGGSAWAFRQILSMDAGDTCRISKPAPGPTLEWRWVGTSSRLPLPGTDELQPKQAIYSGQKGRSPQAPKAPLRIRTTRQWDTRSAIKIRHQQRPTATGPRTDRKHHKFNCANQPYRIALAAAAPRQRTGLEELRFQALKRDSPHWAMLNGNT